MIVTDLTPFSQWCQTRGVTSPLVLDTDGATGYRSMCLPPNPKDLFGVDVDIDVDVDDEGSYRNTGKKVDVVRVPLNSCIVGKDLPTLVDKLKYEKSLGEKSAMFEWLNLFPSLDEFQSMPRFWDSERVEFVSKYDSGQLKSRLDIDQTRIDQQLGRDSTDVDAWALACVDSRSNFLPDETYSLTPLLDMFNHNPKCTTTARVEYSGDDGEDGITGSGTLVLELGYDSVLGLSSSASNGESDKEEDPKYQQNDGDWKSQLFGFFQGGKKSEDSSSSSSTTKNTDSYNPGQEVFISYGEFDNVETLCK